MRIITNAVSSNLADDEVYSIQHYVINIANDLRQVGGYRRVLRFPPQIKVTNITNIMLKVLFNIIHITSKVIGTVITKILVLF